MWPTILREWVQRSSITVGRPPCHLPPRTLPTPPQQLHKFSQIFAVKFVFRRTRVIYFDESPTPLTFLFWEFSFLKENKWKFIEQKEVYRKSAKRGVKWLKENVEDLKILWVFILYSEDESETIVQQLICLSLQVRLKTESFYCKRNHVCI